MAKSTFTFSDRIQVDSIKKDAVLRPINGGVRGFKSASWEILKIDGSLLYLSIHGTTKGFILVHSSILKDHRYRTQDWFIVIKSNSDGILINTKYPLSIEGSTIEQLELDFGQTQFFHKVVL